MSFFGDPPNWSSIEANHQGGILNNKTDPNGCGSRSRYQNVSLVSGKMGTKTCGLPVQSFNFEPHSNGKNKKLLSLAWSLFRSKAPIRSPEVPNRFQTRDVPRGQICAALCILLKLVDPREGDFLQTLSGSLLLCQHHSLPPSISWMQKALELIGSQGQIMTNLWEASPCHHLAVGQNPFWLVGEFTTHFKNLF